MLQGKGPGIKKLQEAMGGKLPLGMKPPVAGKAKPSVRAPHGGGGIARGGNALGVMTGGGVAGRAKPKAVAPKTPRRGTGVKVGRPAVGGGSPSPGVSPTPATRTRGGPIGQAVKAAGQRARAAALAAGRGGPRAKAIARRKSQTADDIVRRGYRVNDQDKIGW